MLSRFGVVVALCLAAVSPIMGQQSSGTTNPQAQTASALATLQSSLQALLGGKSTNDITFSGTAERIVGSNNDMGSATLKAVANASSINLSLGSGTWSETTNASTASPTGSWSSPDGVSHPVALHNLFTSPAWFFPAFAISNCLAPSNALANLIDNETYSAQSVQHIVVMQAQPPNTPTGLLSMAHLSQLDFYIDSSTFLPAGLIFYTHPDDNFLIDIPVEIRFSDYRNVDGRQIPFHIQKLFNRTLFLDVQVNTVAINSGLSATNF